VRPTVLGVLFRVFGFAGCTVTSLRRCRTLLGLAARTEFFTRISSNSLVCRSRYAVRLILGFAVFLIRTTPGTFKTPLIIPLGEFSLRLEIHQSKPSRRKRRHLS
jgi:hypothetical protein